MNVENQIKENLLNKITPLQIRRSSDGKTGRVIGWLRDSSDTFATYPEGIPADLAARCVEAYRCIDDDHKIFWMGKDEDHRVLAAEPEQVMNRVLGFLHDNCLIDNDQWWRFEEGEVEGDKDWY